MGTSGTTDGHRHPDQQTKDNKKVALVVGASRGIGRQIAIDLARNGYAVVVAAKTTSDPFTTANPFPPDPNSPQSTINTVEREIRQAGGTATAVPADVRDFDSVRAMVDRTVEIYSRLDVLVYNSGAIWWAPVEHTPMKRFQLMQRVNVEGLYGTIQACLPHLKKSVTNTANTTTTGSNSPSDHSSTSGSGRIIVVSPPIYSRFFRGKTAYAMGKVGMSVLTKGLAMDFERQGLADRLAITSIWPAVAIESAATRKILNPPSSSPSQSQSHPDPETDPRRDLRRPTIFSDAILAMLRCPAGVINGRLELDEDFLRSPEGGSVTDFDKYAVMKTSRPPARIMPSVLPDLTVAEQDDEGMRIDSSEGKRENEKKKEREKAKL